MHDPAMICNFDHVCFLSAPASCIAMSADRCTVLLHKPAVFFLLHYYQRRWVKRFVCTAPAISSCARRRRCPTVFLPVASDSDLSRPALSCHQVVCVILSGLHTALAKYIFCYTAPPQHLQRWFTCKKTLKNHTGLVTRSSAVVAERATHSCCLAYYLAGCDCRSYHHNSVGVPIDQQLVSDMPTMLYRVLNSSTVPEAAGRSETLRARNALLYDTVQLAQLFLLLYLRTYHQ